MILTQRNELQYDSKNFDSYQNVYTVYIDRLAIERNKQRDLVDYEYLHIKYDYEVFSIYFNDNVTSLKEYENGNKIIFGHFYNGQNYFLYKNIHNGKVIGYKINKCKLENLYFNKNNHILMSHSYREIVKQLKYINHEQNVESRQDLKPNTIGYVYLNDEEELIFGLEYKNRFNIDYENECLKITDINYNNVIILN